MTPFRLLLILGIASIGVPARAADAPRKIDFNRDVRPILADNCFQCHGPDEKQRKAKLRLDTRDGLLAETSGGHAVVPGNAGKSDLVARITAKDPRDVMPPAKFGKTLTAEQIATLKAWIDQGANWSAHWAFTAPVRPEPPRSRDAKGNEWVRNPIDAFVLARLEREGLSPSPPADKVTLIRRVTLDLTGFPPTPEEVDAYLKDTTADAYEKVVDRLLASPRYGERMAWRWLEAARYADTNGYQTDAARDMWRWRDWVIEAYNRNLPFDQFTIEQLAGDLLSNPTLDQRIATGFNRNHRGNSEGGIVPEEYAVEYVADRVETTATVWLGQTFTCCRCHDHKYDPFPQADFYRLFAYFNNVPEKGRAVKFGNSPPLIKAPTRAQEKELAALDAKVRAAEVAWREVEAKLPDLVAFWERGEPFVIDWRPDRGLADSRSFAEIERDEVKDTKPVYVPGRAGKPALVFDGSLFAALDKVGDFGFDDRFSFAVWVKPKTRNGAILSRMPEQPQADGYAVELIDGKVRVSLTKRWLDDALRVETEPLVATDRWQHVAVSYDGSRLAAGVKVYIDSVEQKTTVLLDELNQSFQNKEPLRVGSAGGKVNRFAGQMDDLRVYDRVLDSGEAAILAVPTSVAEILEKRAEKRTQGEREKLTAYFVSVAGPKPVRDAFAAVRAAREERAKLWDAVPTVMVMEEMPTPRDTHILTRGEYDKKGAKVTAGVPGVLPPLPAGAPNNRLGFARWLVDPANPLTARVAVNRAWQFHFGRGLVATPEDFGTQGAFPSHPELLDWLAVEFVTPASGGRKPTVPPEQPADASRSPNPWSLKHLHKLIVTSATYRQSSRVTKELLARDPENRLLARFPRLRLSAEVVRDQALFASGLLVEKLGGPSVKPYQPAGLWNELSGAGDYVPDTGEGLYRRSLYTFWKRTAPPPVMAAFDAAGRETCWVRESRTNTPLQALALLNETAFVEAARALAQRVMKEAKTTDDRLTRAFRHIVGRPPTDRELQVLRANFDFQFAEYRKNPPGFQRLMTVGGTKADPSLDGPELAAYTVTCNLLLNLDEVVTRE